MVVDQVGSVDQTDWGTEPAIADQAGPQVVAPEQSNPINPPPALDYVQDRMNDAKPGGGEQGPGDEEEYAEYPDGPPAEPKQEPQDELELAPAQVQPRDAGDPSRHPTPSPDQFSR